jgi:Ca2+/Na+ antiporter
MCYEIEVFAEKIILRKGNIIKEVFNIDVKVVKIEFLDNLRAKLLLSLLVLGVLTAFFLNMHLGIFEVLFILCLLSYVLFFEFEKCRADLTILTNKEKIKFKINSNKIELIFEMIEKLHMKDYNASIGKINVFKNVA